MERETLHLINVLSFFGKGESPKRLTALTELMLVLLNHPNDTITLEEIENHEELTARQKTWMRQIFKFKLT